ncbi:MAG TPA: hypothetical protein GX501_05910 [Clostridiaceae bacterium]|nr:hypothetical protein [Clostridiaceae bacterium]
MELEMGRKPSIALLVSHFLDMIRAMAKQLQVSEDTGIKCSSRLKQFYRSECLEESLEIVKVNETIDKIKTFDKGVRLD